MTNGRDGITHLDEHNHIANQEGDGIAHLDEHNQVAIEVDVTAEPDVENQIDEDSQGMLIPAQHVFLVVIK